MEEKSERPSPLGQAKQIIKRASTSIAAEYARTDNSWSACFVTPIFCLEMNLDRARDKGELSLEEWEKYQQRLEALKIKSAELSSTFPTKEVSPDPEIKETLIAELDVFNEELYKPKELIGSK